MPSLPIESTADKAELRRFFRSVRNRLSPVLRQEYSAVIAQALTSLPLYRDRGVILFYAPIQSEVDLLPLASLSLAEGKTVAFPRSHPEDHTLTFHAVTELSELTAGTYGVLEPGAALPSLTRFSEAICLTPALAFDRHGYRLGYGGGYYDRFFATFDGISIGIAFGDCLCDALPHTAHDRRVDLILTEGGVLAPDEHI